MLKNAALAVVAVLFVGTTAKANDLLDQVAGMDLTEINETVSEVDDLDLAGLDVDQLAEEAGAESDSDAIEACFRRFGYRHRGYGCYRSYSNCYHNYNTCYHSCYRPLYCCRPVTYSVVNYCAPVCAPVCTTYAAPICHSYWGCH